jgi:glucuronate isomerase
MRINGIKEKFITGYAEDYDKYLAWVDTIENCIGSPLYHWTHLELQRFFGIDQLISAKNAATIWNLCNTMLKEDGFSARGFIRRSSVEVICTTDDPADSLEYHQQIAHDRSFDVKVLPTFRADRSLQLGTQPFALWLQKLGETENVTILSLATLQMVLSKRIKYFHEHGCCIADMSFETIDFIATPEDVASVIFIKGLSGDLLSAHELNQFKSNMLVFLAGISRRKNG